MGKIVETLKPISVLVTDSRKYAELVPVIERSLGLGPDPFKWVSYKGPGFSRQEVRIYRERPGDNLVQQDRVHEFAIPAATITELGSDIYQVDLDAGTPGGVARRLRGSLRREIGSAV